MALAGPQLALPPKDGEDVNFFDEIADDLGRRSDGLPQNVEGGEAEGGEGLGEALSKLNISHEDHAAAEIAYSGDQIWMQETVSDVVTSVNPTAAITAGPIDASREIPVSSLNASSVDGNADAGIPCDVPVEESDLQDPVSRPDFVSRGVDLHSQAVENAGLDLARSQSLQSNGHGLPKFSSQPVVKELQWSIFSETYTSEEGPNALNDFLSELDAGTGELSNHNPAYQPALHIGDLLGNAPRSDTLSGWKVDKESLAGQNITNAPSQSGNDGNGPQFHDNGDLGIHSQLNSHQDQLETNGFVFPSHYGTGGQHTGEPILQPGFAAHSGAGNYGTGIHMQGDHNAFNEGSVLQLSQTFSSDLSSQYNSGEVQLGGSYTSNGSVESHQQVYSLEQPWESMYPGWYYDYGANMWKQIDGWHLATSSAINEQYGSRSIAGSDSCSISGTVNAVSSQLDVNPSVPAMPSDSVFNRGQNCITAYNGAADVSGNVVQEQNTAPAASTWPTGSVSTSLGPLLENEQMNFSAGYEQTNINGISLQSQSQVSWEEQYPGWYFDYQAQQWRQITGEASVHGDDSNIEPSQSQGVSLVKSDQLNTNPIDWQEESRDLCSNGASEKGTLTQNLSFHTWEPPTIATSFEDSIIAETGNVKEAFQFESGDVSMYGAQSYPDGGAQDGKEPEILSNNFYSLQQYSQSHNFYGSFTETKYSPDERPPHALVAFGFGGRLATMKASFTSVPQTIVLHDLNQLVQAAADAGRNNGVLYFSSLNHGGLAGPLVGSGLATKEVLKWVDDRVEKCELEDFQWTESLGVLWNVLRIACKHYGKLRPANGPSSLKTLSEDGPELDLGSLLSTSSGTPQLQAMTATSPGLQSMPSESQLQSVALEMRKRLVDGKKKEALQLAQEGQLWGPALVLASHLGEKAYSETVLQMAQQQFLPGCPLRTLFLLLGGKREELFTTLSLPSVVGTTMPMKDCAGGMLRDWMGNLSIIAANPTNGDEQVITHLGDCLWKDHGKVAGAHICYLVADTNFESFSENARLCLIGADHFKWQRTFATPFSIQRTELYEYAKVLGNPQFILLPFQPYKLLYSHMLVEAGKISEARRYCQAVTKALKNAVRTPEIEFCRQAASALEERLRLHSQGHGQGGYNLNSATGRLVGKFIGTLDNTLHRIMGGPPPRQASEPSLNKNLRDWYSNDQRVGNPANGHEASMLGPSMQNNNRQMEASSRSVSEPNLSWSPRKKEHKTMTTSSNADVAAPKENKSEVRQTGYLSQLFSRAVGFMKSKTKKADLGDTNRFYYNEELKKWVEEGTEDTMEETVLPPPPITASFVSHNGEASLEAKVISGTRGPGAIAGNISSPSEMPLLPPSGNQSSARGRLNGLRSRYVDTFNKGGALPAKSTGSPLVPTSGWAMVPPPTQFFMSAATSTDKSAKATEQLLESSNSFDANNGIAENSLKQTENETVPPSDSSSSFPAVPSMDKYSNPNSNITPTDVTGVLRPEVTHFSSSTLPKDSGEVPSSHPIDTAMNPTQSSVLLKGSYVESGRIFLDTKLNHYMHTARQDLNSMPVPPVIELQKSSVGVESSLLGKSEAGAETGLPNNERRGIFTDMQEVEL